MPQDLIKVITHHITTDLPKLEIGDWIYCVGEFKLINQNDLSDNSLVEVTIKGKTLSGKLIYCVNGYKLPKQQ